jgi:ubiquinone/menaquinone biosynthesis C-methylase UbiE
MNWLNFWDKQAEQASTLEQVGRNGVTAERMYSLMQQQAAFMAQTMHLQPHHHLLDVCCGNGVFTQQLLPYCASVLAVDLSPKLIETAINQNKTAVVFDVADALHLKTWPQYHQHQNYFDAITLCFSFQYFETVKQGGQVIENLLGLLKPGGQLLLTDVPDRAKFFAHYNTLSKIAGLVVQMAKGKNVMGKFWDENELQLICENLHVVGQKINQPNTFAYAHYRMDYLITKPA